MKRSNKDLLKIVLKYCDLINTSTKHSQFRGIECICHVVNFLVKRKVITSEEYLAIWWYMSENAPIDNDNVFNYWWAPGEIAPRKEWLRKNINLLNTIECERYLHPL